MVVKQAEIQGKVQGPGTVQSKVPVTVSPKITGILEKLYADQGDYVHKGQLLAEMDSAELRAREVAAQAAMSRAQRDLGRAQADMGKAQANLGLAHSNYQRDLEVFKPGYISQAAFDTTKAQLKVAESEVEAYQAAVAALQAGVKQAESETKAAAALRTTPASPRPWTASSPCARRRSGTTLVPAAPFSRWWTWTRSGWPPGSIRPWWPNCGKGSPLKLPCAPVENFPGQVARLNREGDTVTRELEVDVKFDAVAQTPGYR